MNHVFKGTVEVDEKEHREVTALVTDLNEFLRSPGDSPVWVSDDCGNQFCVCKKDVDFKEVCQA